MSLLAPKSFATVGMTGALSVSNRLAVASASTLVVSGSYSGVPYVLNGPAFVGTPPYQLGFKRGDRLKLVGATGTEPNHGRELSLLDPATITILESLVFPDANEYEFTVSRRSPCVLTLTGRDALAQLCTWSAFSYPDVPFTACRPRWVGVGSDGQLEADGVVRLASPLQVTTGVYLKALDASLTSFPTFTSVLLKTVFAVDQVSYAVSGVVLSETGLLFDAWVSGSGSVDPTLANNTLALYESFDPLAKLDSFSMEVSWELQF